MAENLPEFNIDNIPIPVFVLDLLNNVIHCNREFESLLSISKKDIIGTNIKLIFNSESIEAFVKKNIELIKTKDSQTFNAQFENKSGGLINVLLNQAFLKNSDGNIIGILCSCIKSEDSIIKPIELSGYFKSEIKYHDLIDNINEGIFIIKQGYLVSISKKLCEILDKKNCDLLGLPFWHLSKGTNKEIFISKFIDCIEHENEEPFSFNFHFEENTIKHIEFQLRFETDKTMYGIARDITDSVNIKEIEKSNLEKFQIISDFTNSILNISYPEDIFDIIGKKIKSVSGNSIVLMNVVDIEKGLLKNKKIYGLNLGFDKVISALGLSTPQIDLNKNIELKQILLKDNIFKNEGIPFYIENNKIAIRKWTLLKKTLGIDQMYLAGFSVNGELLASIAIYTKYNTEKLDFNLIKALISQSAIAIKRWITEKESYLSKIKYISITDNISESAYNVIDFKFSYINKSFERLFKYSNLEIIGRNFEEIINPKNQIFFNEQVDKKINSNDLTPIILECVDKENNSFIAEISVNSPDNGRNIFGIIRNITDRIKVDERLKKITSAITQSNNFIYLISNDGVIDYVNEKVLEYTGYSSSDVIGKNYNDFYAESNIKFEKIKHDLSQIESKNYELNRVSKNNYEYWVSLNVSFVKDNNNKITHFLFIEEEITEKKLLREKNQYESFINEQLAIVSRFILKPGLTIEEIAENIYQTALKISNAKIGFVSTIDKQNGNNICHTLKNFHGDCNISNEKKEVFPSKKTTNDIEFGHCFKNKSAHYINKFNNAIEINEHIQITNFLSVPAKNEYNIFGQIALANKEGGFNDDDLKNIEKLADIYTLAIIRKQIEKDLIHAKILAEESDLLKSVFLANMSHEIRTPLNNIVGFSNLLNKKGLTDQKREDYTGIIKTNSKYLLNLINDILDISKINANQINFTKTVVDIEKLLEEIYDIYNNELIVNKRNITLSYEIELERDEKFVSVDEIRLKQIITNLLNNALKFTDKGTIKFGCKLENQNLVFHVSDTGIGISKDKIEIIFDRFRQEDENLTRKYSGAGLGLAICKGLVELMSGKIWVDSEKFVGSTFYFTVPFVKPTNINTNYIKSVINKQIDWKKSNILLVDDNRDIHIYYDEIFNQLGLNCIHCYFGKDAVELFKIPNKIDLVLMDIQLLDISGYEATRKIKEINSNVPVIAHTAFAMVNDRKKALDNGCDEYISKPIDEDALIELLKKFLS